MSSGTVYCSECGKELYSKGIHPEKGGNIWWHYGEPEPTVICPNATASYEKPSPPHKEIG